MATISSVIKLHDGMSPALRSMNRALNVVLSSFESMQRMSGKAIDTTSIRTARQELSKANVYINKVEQNLKKTNVALDQVEGNINQNTAAQQRFNNAVTRGTGGMSRLASSVKTMVGAYLGIQGVGNVLKTADTLTQTNARLNLMNDGSQSTAELEDKIYRASMRSRAGFVETADVVAKLGQRAGHIFKNNDEVITFSETLNKMFAIAGTSQQEMYSATLQLTQALGSGVLRGEEFRAVFEAAPNVIQNIADYLNLPIGKMKELADDGKISAEMVKNAMFASIDKVNKQFASMPVTWGQVWTLVKNYTLKATRPILQAISNITRSKRFIRFANEMGNIITRVSGFFRNLGYVVKPILGGIFDMVAGIYNFFKNNWSLIAPIIFGIAAAFLVLKAPMMAVAIWTGICTTATKLWAAAQAVFNAVMAANPIGLVIIAIIALVALFYIAIAAVNKWCGTSLSATGMIAGAFTWLWALLQNIFIGICNAFIGIYNIAIGTAQWCVDAWNWAGENMGIVFDNIGIWWDNLWIDAQIGLNNFIAWALGKLSSLAEKIQPLADLLDIDLSGISKAASKAAKKSADLQGSKKSYKSLTAFSSDADFNTARYMKFKDLGEAYDKGYKWGDNLSNKVGAFFSGEDFKNLTGEKGGTKGLNDIGKALSGALGDNPALDDIKNGIADGNGLLGDISNKLDRDESELNFMRDLATQRSINRSYFTEIRTTQNNNNSINSALDIDAVVARFKQQLAQSFNASAEGLHY